MLFLFMSRFCAASVVPLTWHYIPVPLLTALGTRVRARLGIGLHVRRLRPLFLFESLCVTSRYIPALSFTYSADPGRTTVVELQRNRLACSSRA